MSEANDIKGQIDILIKFQVLDDEIYALNREKREKPEQLKAIEESLQAKKTGIQTAEKALKELQLKLKEKEVTLQQKEAQIKKLQGQLFQLKTNKEYSTMITEIKGIEADNSFNEEDIINIMVHIDSVKQNIMSQKELFKQEEASSQKEKDIINNRLKEIDNRFSELSKERERITPEVDKEILAIYERVLKNRDGLALAEIEDNACGGCHMNLPPQVISEVRLRERVITCDSCLRILYINDNEKIS